MAIRTVTALYESRAAAERARAQLMQLPLPADAVEIIEQDNSLQDAAAAGHHGRGLWARIKDMFLPDEDREIYEEGIRRGGFLLYARAEDNDVDRVIAILDASGPIDIDERQKQWASEGWERNSVAGLTGATTARSGMSGAVDEERIPIVEEQIRIGKREMTRGGVRVRAYVVEEPVHEEVRLRDERVEIERRPIDQPVAGRGATAAAAANELLQDRTVEMTERTEEAVVDKEARVKEELVVRKRADERVERIDDTVRHTEVDVDDETDVDGKRPVTGRPSRTDQRPGRH
jgi:uncharacterized protein (TIGR02271 family)